MGQSSKEKLACFNRRRVEVLALWCEQGKLLPATLASHTQRPGSLASDLTPWERPAESSSRWPKSSWALTCAWETLDEARLQPGPGLVVVIMWGKNQQTADFCHSFKYILRGGKKRKEKMKASSE